MLMAIRGKTRSLGFVRSSNEKALAGVCAGLARRFNWNLTVVRCGFVFALSFGFAAAAIYGVCWIAFDEGSTRAR